MQLPNPKIGSFLSIKDIIKSQIFFTSLNENEVEKLASIATVHNYEKGYIHSYEHSYSSELLFLVHGLARAYKMDKYDNQIFLYYIYENSMISEISDVETVTYETFSNIELIEDSQILTVNYEKFKEYFLDKNILYKAFTKEIINRSLQLQSIINREFLFDAVSKVSMMIDENLQMFNKLKRHEISEMLHIQPATLSRVLSRLKRDKIIDIIHGKVEVKDMVALVEVYKDKIDD